MIFFRLFLENSKLLRGLAPAPLSFSFIPLSIILLFFYSHLTPPVYLLYTSTMMFLLFCLGVALLWLGGNFVVDGAANIARRFRVSELIIGLTLVSIGTSLPELIVSIVASFQQESDVIVGNIIGSNISNTTLILGCVGVLSPLAIPSCRLRREIGYYLICLLALGICFFVPGLMVFSRVYALCLLGLFVGAIVLFFMPSNSSEKQADFPATMSVWMAVLLFSSGCVLLPLGGHLLVDSALKIALVLGISKAVVSLFGVALGTSLPELATSLIAARKKNSELAIGNILGSNIFNITLILGTSVLIRPFLLSVSFLVDYWVMLGTALPLFLILFWSKRPDFSRLFSAAYLLIYGGYCVSLLLR